jgi:hypothetical protein
MQENMWLCENQVDNGKITNCEDFLEKAGKE